MGYSGKFHTSKDSIRKIKIGDMLSVPGTMKYEYSDTGKGMYDYMVTDVYNHFIVCVDDKCRPLTLSYGDLVVLGYLDGGGFMDRELGFKGRSVA